jgi:hypothetical protein
VGGNDFDDGSALALDSVGNAYLAGETKSLNYPSISAVQSGYSGVGNCFFGETLRQIVRLIESRQIHFAESSEGFLTVCALSLASHTEKKALNIY